MFDPTDHLGDIDDVAERLRHWREQAGSPSFATIARRISARRAAGRDGAYGAVPRSTVYDCFRAGRRRLDLELVVDIAAVLGLDEEACREFATACWAVQHRADAASIVSVRSIRPQLTGTFVGRQAPFASLRTAGGIQAIVGMPGCGKTTLALRVAESLLTERRVARVILADLRGYDPGRPPADRAALVEAIARVAGVPGPSPAAGSRDRCAQIVHHLTTTATLLILDDAADADQISGLAAAADADVHGLIIVTSRTNLAALVGDERNRLLEPFGPSEALGLLRQAAPSTSAIDFASEPAAELVSLLGGLPLAVAALAGRIAERPEWSAEEHLEALRSERSLRLGGAVSSAIDASYRAMTAPARRLLRLFATQDCAALDRAALAVLGDLDAEQARSAIGELLDGHLLLPDPGSDRFRLHALVREAGALASIDVDRPSERTAAGDRLGDHLSTVAWAARRSVFADPSALDRYATGRHHAFADADAARRWLDDNVDELLALAASQTGGEQLVVVRLAEALALWLDRHGRYHDALVLHHHALDASRQLGDRCGEARALLGVGQAQVRLGERDGALTSLERAVALATTVGDDRTVMAAENALALQHYAGGSFAEALQRFRAALVVAEARGLHSAVAAILDNIAMTVGGTGDWDTAENEHRRAYEYARTHGQHDQEAASLANLSFALNARGSFDDAMATAQQALDHRACTAPSAALARYSGGMALLNTGRADAALEWLQQALACAGADAVAGFEAAVRNGLGETLLALGDVARARPAFDAAHRLAVQCGDADEQRRAERGRGEIERARRADSAGTDAAC